MENKHHKTFAVKIVAICKVAQCIEHATKVVLSMSLKLAGWIQFPVG